jgi:cystathionine beta-lyase
MSVPQGTYLAWIDLTAYEIDDPADYLLDQARVALTGGLPFGTGVSGFARFNFATEPDLIVEMVDRMAAALAV